MDIDDLGGTVDAMLLFIVPVKQQNETSSDTASNVVKQAETSIFHIVLE